MVIEAQDKTTAVLDRVTKSLAQVTGALNNMSRSFTGTGAASLMLDTAQQKTTTSANYLTRAMVSQQTAAINLEAGLQRTEQQQLRLQIAQTNAAAKAQQHSGALSSQGNVVSGLTTRLIGLASAYLSVQGAMGVVKNVENLNDAVRKLTLTTGLSTAQASELVFTTQRLGISYDALATPLAQFERHISSLDLMQDGINKSGKTALDILKEYGIATTDATGKILPFQTILDNTRHTIGQTSDGIEKMGDLMQLFSRGGGQASGSLAGLIQYLSLTDAQIKALNDEAKSLGLVLGVDNVNQIYGFQQAMTQAKQALLGIEVELVQAFIPYLEQLSQWFTAHQPMIRQFFADAIPVITNFVKDFIDGMTIIQGSIQTFINTREEFVAAVTAMGLVLLFYFGPEALVIAGLVAITANLRGIMNLADQASRIGHEGILGKLNSAVGGAIKSIPGIGGFLYNAAGLNSWDDQAKQADTNDIWDKVAGMVGMVQDSTSNLIHTGTNKTYAPTFDDSAYTGSQAVFDPSAYDTPKAAKTDAYMEALDKALDDGVISLKEFNNLNDLAAKQGLEPLTIDMVANMEVQAQLADGTAKLRERMYELEKETDKLTISAGKSDDALAQMAEAYLTSTLDLQKKGLSTLLSQPTVESANLAVETAMVNEQVAKQKELKDQVVDTKAALKDTFQDALNAVTDRLTQMSRALDDANYGLDEQKKGIEAQLKDLGPGQMGTKKILEDQITNIDNQKDLLKRQDDLQKRTLDDQKAAIERQKQDQSTAVTTTTTSALDKLKASIDTETATRSAHLATLKAESELADASLPTDKQLDKWIGTITDNIKTLSGQLVTVNSYTGTNSIPQLEAATNAMADWTQALKDSQTVIQAGTPSHPGLINPGAPVSVSGGVHFHFAPGPNPDAAYLLRDINGGN